MLFRSISTAFSDKHELENGGVRLTGEDVGNELPCFTASWVCKALQDNDLWQSMIRIRK